MCPVLLTRTLRLSRFSSEVEAIGLADFAATGLVCLGELTERTFFLAAFSGGCDRHACGVFRFECLNMRTSTFTSVFDLFWVFQFPEKTGC